MNIAPSFTVKNTDNYLPLDRNTFALEFSQAGSTILNHQRYAQHARKIIAEERNFPGLFALNTLLANKEGQYRRDDVTAKANHPILLFFQVHAFHEADKAALEMNPNTTDLYLPDRPDLDKILALLHDEGEDTAGFTKEDLIRKMHDFIDNINTQVEQNNCDFPRAQMDYPSEAEIQQMRQDVDAIAASFDALTKDYHGTPKNRPYYSYHVDMLADERACRIKVIDKACNVATFSYRNKEMLENPNDTGLIAKYKEWHTEQVNKVRDLYFNQNFSTVLGGPNFDEDNEDDETNNINGFIDAACTKFPSSTRLLKTMKKVIRIQLNIYENDISNLSGKHGSPSLQTKYKPYDSIIFSPRINLIQITQSRLAEMLRLDRLRQSATPKHGMFGIPFDRKLDCLLPPINRGQLATPSAFYQIGGLTNCPS